MPSKNNSVKVKHGGKTLTIWALSEITGIKYSILYNRIKVLGWTVKAALETPVQVQNRNAEGANR